METVQDFSPKDKYIAGSMLVHQNPVLAKDFVTSYNAQKKKALDSDTSNIFDYFIDYCEIKGIESLKDTRHLRRALHKQDKVDARRLFIGAIVKIYRPQLLFSPVCMENGLGQKLVDLLGMDNGNVSKTIDEVKAWYIANSDNFRDQLDDLVEVLVDKRRGYVGSMFKNVA